MTQAEQSTTNLTTSAQSNLTDEEVALFLAENPEFFQLYPELLETLSIPHETGTAISLVEKQIKLLREKNRQLEEQLNSLIAIAHDNNNTQQQIHKMVLEVLASTDAESALQDLTNRLSKSFQVEHVAVRLLADKTHPLQDIARSWLLTSKSARDTLDDFTPTYEPLCGRLKQSQLKRLFGEQAESIGSSVLIPLRKGFLHGVIALGSSDEHRFNPGMDTLYLRRLGEQVAAALLRYLD